MATTFTPALQPRPALPGESPFGEEYLPESDGRPMAETDAHRNLMIYLLLALEEFFREQLQVYISGNIFVYYRDEAGVRQSVSPDVFVVRGVEKKIRRIYNLDEEGRAPEVVIELTSTSTKVEDLVMKHYIYARLGVQEYFLFDPYTEAIQPALRGFRLEKGEYVPMSSRRKGASSLLSEVLGLELRVEDGQLRLYNPKTGERLRSYEEAEEERRSAEIAKQAAEAENARLREELAKLRSQQS